MNDLNDLLRGTSCQSLENSRNQVKRKKNRDFALRIFRNEIDIILLIIQHRFSIRQNRSSVSIVTNKRDLREREKKNFLPYFFPSINENVSGDVSIIARRMERTCRDVSIKIRR